MFPAMVAGTIGTANWTQGSLEDPASADPSRSSAALWEGKVQLHPETDPEDPAYKKWGFSLSTTPVAGEAPAPGKAPMQTTTPIASDKSLQELNPKAAENV